MGGGSYVLDEGSGTTLDASASSDSDGTIVSYKWDLDNDGQYDDASGESVPFSTTEDGVYTVGLQVTDDRGAVSTDTAQVTVNNVGPTADAGGPYVTQETVSVQLSAAGSSDPGNDIVSYDWDLDNDGQFDDASGATVQFAQATAGDYPVAVRVTDEDGAISTDTTLVTVEEPSATPAIYVYDIRFESAWGGWLRQAVFEIRSDSDGDGLGSAADDVAGGVAITVEFAGQTYSGTTDANGQFRTGWQWNPGSGSYAEVHNLALTGYVWNPLTLDLEDDSDGDGLPDGIL